MTFIRRIGNKQRHANLYVPFIPQHEVYIELFFGAGGMFFNKERAKYSFLNDLDQNIFTCFDVLMNRKAELLEYLEMIPYCSAFWKWIKELQPQNDIEKVVKFLVLSNFGLHGKPDTLTLGLLNTKKQLLKQIETTYKDILKGNNQFLNYDFKEVLSKIGLKHEIKKVFIFADPPYLHTTNNYNTPSWTYSDSKDLFAMCANSEHNFAICEFDTPEIMDLASEYKLNTYFIKERQNLGNRRKEYLFTNYEMKQTLF